MISVCIATYNGEKYFKQQLESILSQLSQDDEVIISDDGSKDKTIAIIEEFNDPRIHVFVNEGKHGYVGNFENALLKAKGDYIFLSDQDDVWLPNKVSTVLTCLKEADLVVHNAELIDGEGVSMGKDYFSSMHTGISFWSNFLRPRYLGCCMAFNRKVYNIALPFPNYWRAHDYWIGCIGSLLYNCIFIDTCLIQYRRHGNNFSPSSEKSQYPFYFKIWKRFSMFVNITSRLLRKKK